MPIVLRTFCVALLLLFTGSATAMASLDKMDIRRWTTADNLPHNRIHDMAQTPDGFLWLATWEGVARFDGSRFRIFDGANTPDLGRHGVRALAVDADGALWLGTTRDGLLRLQNDQWELFDQDQGLPANQILDLLVDSDNRLWIATEDQGIAIYANQRFTHIPPDRLLDSTILSLHATLSGAIWAVTRHGINVIEGDQVSVLDQRHGLPERLVRAYYETPAGKVYVGTEVGLYVYRNGRFNRDSRWPDGHTVSSIISDGDGGLYLGSFSHGLFHLDHNNILTSRNTSNGMPNNQVIGLLVDNEGHLWAGTNGGLTQLLAVSFSTLTTTTGLSDNYVRAVLEASDGTLWIGTSNGLNRWRDGQMTRLGVDDGLVSDSIISLAENDGQIWVGSYGFGVNIIDRSDQVQPLTGPALPSGHVRSILHARNGDTYIGTVAGLVQRRDASEETVEHVVFDKPEGLPRGLINALYEAANGDIWIGTAEGMARLIDGSIQSLNDSAGFDNADVFAFAEDTQGHLWIGSETGLLRWRGDSDGFERIGRDHGLPEIAFFSILIDAKQQMWLSSNRGIFRISLPELRIRAAGGGALPAIDHFTEEHGMATRQANGASQPAAALIGDNQVGFATAGGLALATIDAMSQVSQQQPPGVTLEQVSVDGVNVSHHSLALAPNTKSINFRVAGVHFGQPQALRYRYKLDGFSDWTALTDERTTQFTNLPPDDYVFHAQASLPGGFFSEDLAVAFSVIPAWYQRHWVQALLTVAALLTLLAIIGLRVRHAEHRARELELEVDARTTDLKRQTAELKSAAHEKNRLMEELEMQSRRFEHQAKHDGLTGLANRREFDRQLRRLFAESRLGQQDLTVALIDIDHFKRINDSFSHQAGDNALIELAALMQEHLAIDEAIQLARYGGEEFAALFPGLDAETVRSRCEAFRHLVEEHEFGRSGDGFFLTISVGLCDDLGLPSHEKLVNQADNKLYEAKSKRNCVVR